MLEFLVALCLAANLAAWSMFVKLGAGWMPALMIPLVACAVVVIRFLARRAGDRQPGFEAGFAFHTLLLWFILATQPYLGPYFDFFRN